MAMSMFSSIYSFSGFVFVIVISPKFVVGWFWVAVGLALVFVSAVAIKGAKVAVVEVLESLFEMNQMTVAAVGVAEE